MLLSLYRMVTHLTGPLIALHLHRRVRFGKEDGARLGERFGQPSLPRPDGPLIWFHAASVGEALAALPLIEALLEARPALQVLVTTGTVTSAKLMAARLPLRAFHQFVPIDRGAAWWSFLTFWRPDAAFLIESEIWPNLVLQAKALAIPLAVINGRMSARSFRHWQRARSTAARLFAGFELCLARNDEDAERFRLLGARDVRSLGDLKHAAPSLPVDDHTHAAWLPLLAHRTLWLAASTHPGEEEKILEVHKALALDFPKLLTIIVPRHPERGNDLAAAVKAAGLRVGQRSKGMIPEPDIDVYLGDSLGELGLFYSLSPLAFIGGSLVPHGGQNPLEAARLGSALLFGPHTDNFDEIAKGLIHRGAAKRVLDIDQLKATLHHLLSTSGVLSQMADRARQASAGGDLVLDRILRALLPLLDRASRRVPSLASGASIETADARP